VCGRQVNIEVNFVFLIVGLMVSSAVPALFFMLTWSRVRVPSCLLLSSQAG
jgi:hypothetical protein